MSLNEFELFPYQLEGANWLTTKKFALLADEMGLGKSAQSIRACDLLNARRILVLCPASARFNWAREFDRFSSVKRKQNIPLTAVELMGYDDKELDIVTICSYGLVDNFPGSRFDVLILDEAHYLKSHKAQRAKAVFGSQGLVHRADRIWALSGTPCPNNASELWILLYTFGCTPLKFDAFVEHFCTYYDKFFTSYRKSRQVTGTNTARIPELRSLLKPISLRRRKEDVLTELPPIFYTDQIVSAGKVELDTDASFVKYAVAHRTDKLFEQLAREELILKALVDSHNADSLATALTHMASSLPTLRRYCGLQKVEPIINIVDEELMLAAYEKIVIFAIHQTVIEGLRVGLKKWNPVTLYGGTPPEKRQRNIDRFQTTQKYRVFIGQIHAAGNAINLTAANNIIVAEPAWDPGSNAQAVMRCHRIGQTKPVMARFIGLLNSIDDKITQVLRRKTRELQMLLDPDVAARLMRRAVEGEVKSDGELRSVRKTI